jgi:hypothetical protein
MVLENLRIQFKTQEASYINFKKLLRAKVRSGFHQLIVHEVLVRFGQET